MKILLSPAKLMSMESDGIWNKTTSPKFLSKSETLIDELKTMSTKDLEKLMSISKNLAELNADRYQVWNSKPGKKNSLQAALAFDGQVYKGLEAETLSDSAKDYLNKNVFILSGLYGLLSPSDKIMLYRLEMGSKLDVNGSKNLYGYWQEDLTDYVNSTLKKDEIILNLASVEYSKALNDDKLKSKKIDVEFLEYRDGKMKTIMAYFKKARGMLTRYCAENNIDSLDDVKLFNEEKYSFDEKSSTEDKLVFIR